jgi:hypothetical protein
MKECAGIRNIEFNYSTYEMLDSSRMVEQFEGVETSGRSSKISGKRPATRKTIKVHLQREVSQSTVELHSSASKVS